MPLQIHRDIIKQRIADAIWQFRRKEIDHNTLLYLINGNINALDNLDKSIESAVINLGAEMETIYYMYSSNVHYELMLQELKKFEPYLDKI